VQTPIPCLPTNKCFTAACNPDTGICVQTPIPCLPADDCHVAECDARTGNCVQFPKPPAKYTFTCPADIELDCGSLTDPKYTGGTCKAFNLDGTPAVGVTITYEDMPIAPNCTGQAGIVRIFFCIDPCGNKTDCNFAQRITFKDTTPPVIICPSDIVTCVQPVIPCLYATDNCLQPVTVTYTRSDKVAIFCNSQTSVQTVGSLNGSGILASAAPFPAGTTVVTATATDACGNTAKCTFRVTINSIICSFNECCCTLCPGQSKWLKPNFYGGVGPYTLVWSKVEDPNWTMTQVITGPNDTSFTGINVSQPGHYKVTITDSMGCVCSTADYGVTVESLQVLINASCDDLAVCNGNTVILNGAGSGGVGLFKYLWELVTPTGSLQMGTNPTLEVSQAGLYRLTIIDALCQSSAQIAVRSCSTSVTRNIDWWKVHAIYSPQIQLPPGVSCACLQNVFNLMPGGWMNLGYISVGLDQALGLLWGPLDLTGDQLVVGDAVCQARKTLSQQLICAIANITLLNADNSGAGVFDPATQCFYPITTLIAEAQAATQADPGLYDCNSRAWWVSEMDNLSQWLATFNASGASASLPANLRSCGVGFLNMNYVAGHQPDPTTAANCACDQP